jgi:glycosyltransferase involved in cell wall biosynthesis
MASSELDGQRPTVSIVIPCYNYGRYLAEAIESALAQTWQADEIIVVDDGSTDDSLQVAHRFDSEPDIRIISQMNQGAIAAFNNGVRASIGAFFVKLDADDRLHPGYLAATIPPLVASPEAGFAYTGYCWFGSRDVEFPAEPFNLNVLALRPYVEQSALIRRAAFDAAGGYSHAMSSAYEDWDLFLTMAERGWTGIPVPELLLDYRIHPNGRNAITFGQWRRLMVQLYQRHPSMRSAPLPLFLARAIVDRGWRRLYARACRGAEKVTKSA